MNNHPHQKKSSPNKTKNPIYYLLLALLVLTLGGGSFFYESSNDDASVSTEVSTQQTYHFRNSSYLEEHFKKHKNDFSYKTASEYEAGANAVIHSPDALHKTEMEDGDDVYYLPGTNELVIVSTDEYIRTYFKPDNGMEYYNRQ